MPNCSTCGAELSDNDASCPKCAAARSAQSPGFLRPVLLATLFTLPFAVALSVLLPAKISHSPSLPQIVHLLIKANGAFLLCAAAAIAFSVTAIRRIGSFRPITLLLVCYFILIASYWAIMFPLVQSSGRG